MTRAAVIAAMPGELRPLVRGWQHRIRNGVDLWGRRRGAGEWIAACAGAGVGAAERAFAEIEREGAVDLAISAGWAGALRAELATGSAYRVSGVVDARTGERFRVAGASGECILVTTARVAGPVEKQRLRAAHGADLVDMEAAGVARLAAARGIPFHCIKGVSDGPADELPDFNAFISADGRFLSARFLRFAAMRPWLWPMLARMARNGRSAARGLTEPLHEILNSLSP